MTQLYLKVEKPLGYSELLPGPVTGCYTSEAGREEE